jgi:hypothetical protein
MTRCIRGTYGVRYLSTGYSVTSVDIVYQVSVLRHIIEGMRLPLRKIFEMHGLTWLYMDTWVHYRYMDDTNTLHERRLTHGEQTNV